MPGVSEKAGSYDLTPSQTALVDRYWKLAIKYSRQWANSYPFDPSECESRAFRGLVRAAKRYTPSSGVPFPSWLGFQVRRSCGNWQRDERAKFQFRNKRDLLDLSPRGTSIETIADHRRPGTDDVDFEETKAKLLAPMTPRQRLVIEMLAAGHTHTEIARQMGVTAPAIHAVVADARKRVLAVL